MSNLPWGTILIAAIVVIVAVVVFQVVVVFGAKRRGHNHRDGSA
jgi:heme/copper-type cytochrome/quinol oxidase subunit 2